MVVEKTEFNQVKYSQGREWAMIKGAAGQIYIRKQPGQLPVEVGFSK